MTQRMMSARQQMQIYLTQAEQQTWKVDMTFLVRRVNRTLFWRWLRKADYRAARLEVTADLLGRDVPLESYKDLTADERRALILFTRKAHESIQQEVREAYRNA